MEALRFEILRASPKEFVKMNYDAMSWYIRIIPNLALLVHGKFRVPATVKTNATILKLVAYLFHREMGVAET